MALNLPNNVVKFLKKNPEQKFTAREIADWIVKSFPDECREKVIKSKLELPIEKQISAEIASHRPRILKRYPEVKTTEGRPRKYYFTKSSDQAEIKQAESAKTSSKSKADTLNIKEHDLYPILAKYLWSDSDYKIYSMRIDEKRSSNSRGPDGNKWLFPDIVSIEDLSKSWDHEIKKCIDVYKDKISKLWSFEVKLMLNQSNVRKAFFQTVSNSSWANYGYLVARDIATDTLKELRMLSALHGIGIIRLDSENPSESEIMIPARERSEIDWDTVDRLVKENKDFVEYVKLIRKLYQFGELNEKDFKNL